MRSIDSEIEHWRFSVFLLLFFVQLPACRCIYCSGEQFCKEAQRMREKDL